MGKDKDMTVSYLHIRIPTQKTILLKAFASFSLIFKIRNMCILKKFKIEGHSRMSEEVIEISSSFGGQKNLKLAKKIGDRVFQAGNKK